MWAFLGPEGTSLETPEPWPGASRDDLVEDLEEGHNTGS